MVAPGADEIAALRELAQARLPIAICAACAAIVRNRLPAADGDMKEAALRRDLAGYAGQLCPGILAISAHPVEKPRTPISARNYSHHAAITRRLRAFAEGMSAG